MIRKFSFIDQICIQVNHALTTIFTTAFETRRNPADTCVEKKLSMTEKQNSISCMRVNHTGEVCAQALYRGQLLLCQGEKTREMLTKSCEEETDHLAWTKKRLNELNGRTSYLNPLWYLNSYLIGVIVGLSGDKWSLGFVEETEIQVAKHLTHHLEKISEQDEKSHAIIRTMRDEETQHEKAAHAAGAHELPTMIKLFMQLHSKVMTTVTYYL